MLASPLQPILERQSVVILDGALATELTRHGADLNDPLWSAKILIDAPQLIEEVHYEYLVAGADVITTASYQATFQGFADRGFSEEEAAELMLRSVELAQAARERFWSNSDHRRGRAWPLVAASIGSYGAFLADGSEYTGDYGLSLAELMSFHRPRLALLASSGADLLACETIPSLSEGRALTRLLAEHPNVRAWLSFSCCDGERVCHRESFARCAALANECPQVIAVGINCTSPQFVESLLRIGAGVTDRPLLAYPNRGERWDAEEQCWVDGSGEQELGALALRWRTTGARLIGGCCRTTPADIAELSGILRPHLIDNPQSQ